MAIFQYVILKLYETSDSFELHIPLLKGAIFHRNVKNNVQIYSWVIISSCTEILFSGSNYVKTAFVYYS